MLELRAAPAKRPAERDAVRDERYVVGYPATRGVRAERDETYPADEGQAEDDGARRAEHCDQSERRREDERIRETGRIKDASGGAEAWDDVDAVEDDAGGEITNAPRDSELRDGDDGNGAVLPDDDPRLRTGRLGSHEREQVAGADNRCSDGLS